MGCGRGEAGADLYPFQPGVENEYLWFGKGLILEPEELRFLI
jgi:hypothetical protein